MVELPILHGCCTIRLERKLSGNNRYPHTIEWEILNDNVLVDEVSFLKFRKYHWLKTEEPHSGSYYAQRIERNGGKVVHIILAREILGLPRSPGRNGGVADHRNHDIRDDTPGNLRVATRSQNGMNRIKEGYCQRFKGVMKNKCGGKYTAYINFNGLSVNFTSVLTDLEAGLMYYYAAMIRDDEFLYIEDFPQGEMPSRERRWELMGLVVGKLRLFGYI